MESEDVIRPSKRAVSPVGIGLVTAMALILAGPSRTLAEHGR